MPPSRSRAAALVLAFATGAPAAAETWSAGGLTFSDELGGVRLLSVTGSGALDDPLVLVEEIDGSGPAILVIRAGEQHSQGGGTMVTPAFLSLAVIKIVRNRSRTPWGGFVLELREILDAPSPYGDGLSFDQMETFGRPPHADRFAGWHRMIEPADRIRFYGGSVAPGSTVTFTFTITDPTTPREFYLVQQTRHLISQGQGDAGSLASAPSPTAAGHTGAAAGPTP